MDDRTFGVRDGERTRVGDLERAAFAVHVPAGLCYFHGHFEGDPVLPAVAQLNSLVLPLVHRTWPSMPPLRRATKLKFHQPVRPGVDLTLRLERAAHSATVSFSLDLDGAPASTGALHFGEATP